MAKLKSILLMSTLGILLSGCSNLEVLNPKGPMAEDSHFLIIFSIIMMVFIVVVVLILFLIFIIKYRKTKNVTSGTMHHNLILEAVWFIIPVIILVILAVPTVKSLYNYEEAPKSEDEPVVIYATSAGFKWFFSYPEEKVETVNHVTIPENRPVLFKLQSMDTMTSFWVPQLGGQKYAMTSMTMDWTLEANETGTFKGRNSNFNGEGFSRQTFNVNSVSNEDYDKWVSKSQKRKTIDQDTFDHQILPTTKNQELTYSGTHLAYVDPAADPEYIFHAYKRYRYEPKDPNFYDESEGVTEKPVLPPRKVTVTNPNYERHGMKPMILKNNEKYDSEFKKEEEHHMDEMEKISEDAKNEDEKGNNQSSNKNHGGDK
ncbi:MULTISPECIES: cytochrome aa3 quinol oxidase subunit II [Mammaliicoccus]|uniref:cytochrome aa3 quinol oxidase subunit II n=1 Tax=Mammaliicoccus TaxID=2803850 RepID=UPI0011CA19DF|nr:cytochrome aa3 quinol oxidase subunit II [Mammaliicoccus lentus]QMU10600.1 cytochrome aa3 quinol oxidase subunit II [Mammaliicoccus lentus]